MVFKLVNPLRALITLLLATHEPLSKQYQKSELGFCNGALRVVLRGPSILNPHPCKKKDLTCSVH